MFSISKTNSKDKCLNKTNTHNSSLTHKISSKNNNNPVKVSLINVKITNTALKINTKTISNVSLIIINIDNNLNTNKTKTVSIKINNLIIIRTNKGNSKITK